MTELEEKTERLVHILVENDLDAVIINAQHNFAWLTGGGSNGVDLSRENGIGSIIVTRDGDRFILANVIEIERLLAEEVSEDDFDPIDFNWQGEKANPASVLEKARFVLETNARVATDIPMFSGIPAIEGKIAACRYQLTPNEAERYRSLGVDAGAVIKKVIDNIAAGESEIEIAEKIRHELALGGMTSVVTLVAADERISRYRHPVPTGNPWSKTLLLVTCAKRGGLIASLSRMVCIGDVPDELKIKTEAAAYVNACLLNATRPGVTGAELYQVAANAYTEKGLTDEINRHHQGGAAGYRTRDWVAHPASGEVVQEDQAFAWNPSITGTKVEETCILTAGGIEVLTASPDFPTITTVIDGQTYSSPGVLSI
ncbi:MAG: aminopeptidase P family protein [Pyrinomonadaceae bacterium]